MRYEDVVRAAWAADPDFVTLCKSLYGEGATWETVAKDGPCASDVHVPGNSGVKKPKKIAVMDTRGPQVPVAKRKSEVPTYPRSYKRDDNGRFSSFAGAATHATVAGLSGAAGLATGHAVRGASQETLDVVRRLRGTSEGRRVLLRTLARSGGRTAALAAGAGVATAMAGHHGKAAYETMHNRALLEQQHAKDVRSTTREQDFHEFLGGDPYNAVVRTPNPGKGTDAQTTIRRKGAVGTLHYQDRLAHEIDKRDIDMTGSITGVNDEKRQVFGWASIVEKNGNPVVDLQGDYITIGELEKAAYDYVHKSRVGGAMHRRVDANGNVIEKNDRPYHAADLIESFVVTPEKIEKMGLSSSTPVGWWVGFKVNDDDAWQSVKSGDWKGFSVHGVGRRRPIGEVSDLDISGAELTR